jgi:CDP-diacylglycerol---glycerol-3-phosphate 3-phosphatidyltransferase
MNIPNQLTVFRLVLSFVFLATMTVVFPHSKTISMAIFGIAAFTDFLDGHLARKHNLVSSFGKLMDPLADKVLMTAGFVMLIDADHLPAWIVVMILAREFLVTGLRLVASAEGMVLSAENLGKYKTAIQVVTVLYFLLTLASTEPGSILGFTSPLFRNSMLGPSCLGQILIWGSLILTLTSGLNYVWKNRQLLGNW